MTNQTQALLGELTRCSQDPAAFSAIKQRLLETYFSSVNPDHLPRLMALQDQIEAVRAIGGTPAQAMASLVGDLSDRCDALDLLQRQIIALANI